MLRVSVKKSFGPIARALERAGLSITEISRRSGIHRNTFYKWREGGATPSLRLLRKLAKAIGIEVEELL